MLGAGVGTWDWGRNQGESLSGPSQPQISLTSRETVPVGLRQRSEEVGRGCPPPTPKLFAWPGDSIRAEEGRRGSLVRTPWR